MIGRHLLVLLVISLAFTVVLARNPYFEHYFSLSTTSSISSTKEILRTESISTSSQGGFKLEEYDSFEDDTSSKDDNEPEFIINDTPPTYSGGGNSGVSFAIIAQIVGGVIFMAIVLCIFIKCCCCRGTQTTGIVIPRHAEVSSNITITNVQQPAIIQHSPPEYPLNPAQRFPPQYQQPVLPPSQYAPVELGCQYSPVQPQSPYSPMQPQYSYSPVQPQTHYSPNNQCYHTTSPSQCHNPPGAPPPYNTTARKM